MLRTQFLVIRMSADERTAVNKLALIERLPVSTFARQMLLKEADRRGVLVQQQEQVAQQQPEVHHD